MRKILSFIFLIVMLYCNSALAVENLKGNGDFDLYPNSPIKFATGWIGNESTRWNIFYTSSTTLHSAQLVNGAMVVKTGSDGGINDISLGGVPSSDPTLFSWQNYGVAVEPNTIYTAFAFVSVNKTNADYFNIRQAYENGTMLTALISSRNTGTGYQFMQYQFTTGNNIKWVRTGLVTRSANTQTTYYAAGLYKGAAGQLNKATSITYISPVTSILPDMQPTFTGIFSDEDSTVGICNDVVININGVSYNYDCSGYSFNNLFLPNGVSTYNVTVIDNWAGNTISETYSLYVPEIQYVSVVNDQEDIEDYTGIFSERFIYFVVYIAILVILQSKFVSNSTLYLFGIIEILVEIILFANVNNIYALGGSTQYVLMLLANTYLLVLTGLGIQGEKV